MKQLPSSLAEEMESVNQTHSGSGDNIAHRGSGAIYAGNDFGDVNYSIDDPKACLRDLRTTDSRDEKKRIQDTKGDILKYFYTWVLGHSTFRQWHDDEQSQLLWIRGDPGKGKSMLLCGIIDKWKRPLTLLLLLVAASYLTSFAKLRLRINSATAVLRGLIYVIVVQQPALCHHVRKKYDFAGKELFVGENAWDALSEI
ncbi:uncharacterized protein RAG0_03010 [Rhynchosporium agropyri]|uniref:Nephrocystin 3-like N-terminal domain-containing protein n=1 Tax=Rhynchosporium agropyri TaxID=914238 RepID=A0A1E1K2U5_9HELO|nr:uncharacterized protein RAG0_03010 [Rhynchosporium agropyri]